MGSGERGKRTFFSALVPRCGAMDDLLNALFIIDHVRQMASFFLSFILSTAPNKTQKVYGKRLQGYRNKVAKEKSSKDISKEVVTSSNL